MVRISEDLIRKRAEHNECIISTLEEVSLHQQDIERIEFLDKWCRDLKILYLQSNLIPKIENVGRLKKLEYLNLALNNIERIENLEGCESLTKLDFTVNFIGELTSIENLKELCHLRELYLTGNPCTEYYGYRDFVIATLPRLKSLDGVEIEKSERILATQKLAELRGWILEQQASYKKKRAREKLEAEIEHQQEEDADSHNEPVDKEEQTAKDKEFWQKKTSYTPESRLEVHKQLEETRRRENPPQEAKPKKERRLETEDGRILNCNEAKVDFTLTEDDQAGNILLDVAIFKHMDTSLCDVDVQPYHVKVTLKGKVLQLALPDEVKPDSSSAKRSQITGHLLITMPKVNPVITKPEPAPVDPKPRPKVQNKTELLEVDPDVKSEVDFGNIVPDRSKPVSFLGEKPKKAIEERANSEGFMDDPDVPPLM